MDTLIEEIRDLKRIILDSRVSGQLINYRYDPTYTEFPCEIKPSRVTTSYMNTSDKSITEIIKGWCNKDE